MPLQPPYRDKLITELEDITSQKWSSHPVLKDIYDELIYREKRRKNGLKTRSKLLKNRIHDRIEFLKNEETEESTHTTGNSSEQNTSSEKSFNESNLSIEECFEILQIEPNSSPQIIKTAYKQKIKKCHPDKVASLSTSLKQLAEKESKLINGAFNKLKEQGFAS